MTFTCNVDWGQEIIPDMLEILEEEEKCQSDFFP